MEPAHDEVVRSLLELWDAVDDAVAHLDLADWARPAPRPPADVTDVVVRLTGLHYADPERLRAAIAPARARTATRLEVSTPSPGALAGECLELCLHAVDLGDAVGAPVDLDAHAPATRAACRLVTSTTARLLVGAVGAGDAAVRLIVDGADEGVVHVAGGHRRPGGPDDALADVVTGTSGALLLVLTGRRDPDAQRAAGRLDWSGRAADALVHAHV
jgi:hypothetical protein